MTTRRKPDPPAARQPEPKEEQRGLCCRGCGCGHFRVIYTRKATGGKIRRRRECRHCGRRLTTTEKPHG